MVNGAKNYCFTINNPTDGDRLLLEDDVLAARAVYCVWQIERGEEGTPHVQGYVSLKVKKTIVQLKEWLPRAHFECARGNPSQNRSYCTKEDGRIEGPFEFGELPRGRGARSDLSLFVEAAKEKELTEGDLICRFGDVTAKYPNFVNRTIRWAAEERRRRSQSRFEAQEDWQTQALSILNAPVHPRLVHWFWEPVGGVGKSYFALNYHDGRGHGFIVSGGRHADIRFAYRGQPFVFFDWARDTEERFPYGLVEQFKNGYFLVEKYDSRPYRFSIPYVFVFANFAPDQSRLSQDRWDIFRI